jgi:hypothetical protein
MNNLNTDNTDSLKPANLRREFEPSPGRESLGLLWLWHCHRPTRVTRLVIFFAVLPALVGCSTKEVEWKEEVRLATGQVIIAERTDRYKRVMDVGAGFQRGWLYQTGRVKAELPPPISRTVEWEGTLRPLVLDVLSGSTVYFVGAAAGRLSRDEWRIPDNEKYVVLRMTPDGWERIPLDELPLVAKPNLLASSRNFFEYTDGFRLSTGSVVKLDTKSKIDSRITLIRELKEIVRPKQSGKGR